MCKIKLSPYHTIFYNEWKLNPYGSQYNIVFDQTLSSNLDVNKLERALHRFVSDYLIINSHVTHVNGELYWVKNTEIPKIEHFKFPYTREHILSYVSKPFEIEAKALYRFALFTEADRNFRLVIVLHHLLIDGGSFNTFISDISNYYNFQLHKSAYTLTQQENILKDTNELLNKELESFNDTYKKFWEGYLNNAEPVDLGWVKPKNNISNIQEYRFNFKQETTKKLIKVTKKFGITAYTYSKCILAVLLHKHTEQNEISLSYPIAIKAGMPLVSGSCVNTNINVYKFNTTTMVIDLFKQDKNFIQSVKSTTQNASHYPINMILHNASNELLNIMFAQTNLKNIPFSFTGIRTLKINSDFNIDLPVKIIFELELLEDILNFRVRYDTSKIEKNILREFTNSYERIFLAILNDLNLNISNKLINEYPLLSALEYNKIVYSWNKTPEEYRPRKTITALFEDQVAETPYNIAIVYEDTTLTYNELNEQSNQLADYLKSRYNIKEDNLIALHLNRSQLMLIAILGVLKAGAAYVPIDPTYPEKRIRYILEDSKAKVLITNGDYYDKLAKTLSACRINILALDNYDISCRLKKQIKNNPKSKKTNRNLVYVMYTSGTTGNPKGVMMEDHSAATRVLSMIRKSEIANRDKYLFKTNYTFDVSFSDIFMTLLSGASLYITKSSFDVDEISDLITKNNINICHFVPSQLELIQNYCNKRTVFSKLKTIHVSGEKFKKSLVNTNFNIKYINYYGPTETGEVSYDITDFKNSLVTHDKFTTIGYPLDGSTLYILDSHLTPLPIGVIGELYIGGAGLSRGYLNSPQLTAEKFTPNPFQTKEEKQLNKNQRLYRTGDLARYFPDGNIEYIGRKDNQVKIRGLRIELSEIETTLSNYPGIKQSIVLYQEKTNITDENKEYLVAYYIADVKLDENLILTYLTLELPEYMIPNIVIWLENFPLTRNGKLDIQALPPAHFTTNIANYVAPRNELEEKICLLYADILGLSIKQIGVNDSFFKLGGNSITAIRLLFKLQNYFNIVLNNVFEFKTPAKLAQLPPITSFNLADKLEEIKSTYLKLDFYNSVNSAAIEQKKIQYKKHAETFKLEHEIKPISRVLLTGSTGYLGCHILHQLLIKTEHTVYLLIRVAAQNGPSITPHQRIKNKFKYYFDMDLDIYKNRLIFLKSDITKINLDLDKSTYKSLENSIDSIIHCAALVKHYGEEDAFYQANVQSTINLLELAKIANKDFHYISTIGVFAKKYISKESYNIFTEENIDSLHANLDNIYTKTKYEGEQATLKYSKYGIKTSIYRIGNIAINSRTHKVQENIEDNAFFQQIKTALKLGMIPPELSETDISPVDCTAAAIVALFNEKKLYDQIYHIFNAKHSNLYRLLHRDKSINIKQALFSEFIDHILINLRDINNANQIELFMLHQGWLQPDVSNLSKTVIFQDKTDRILKQLNIEWPTITSKMLSNIIKNAKISHEL